MYRECREGTGGPSGGASHPKGPHGLWEEVNQLLVGRTNPLNKAHAARGGKVQVEIRKNKWKWNPTWSRIGVGLLHLSYFDRT